MKKSVTCFAALFAMLFGSLAFGGGSEVRLQAQLSSGGTDLAGGAVEFRQRFDQGGRRQFSVQVENLQPGDMFDVMIAGQVVGKITIDDFGRGGLNYDDNFEPGVDDPATRFPDNFPALDGGEQVVVGPVSGTLQAK